MPRSRTARRGRARLGWIGELAAVLLLAALYVGWRMRAPGEAGGIVKVADDEVAVVTRLWTGEQRSVLTPGFEWVLPRLELVHKLDKTPVQYLMQGDEWLGPNHVPRLVVRARSGSLFWFERVSIQYGLDLRRLAIVLQDSGPGDGYRSGIVDAFARAVLFDELGRFDPAEVVSPDSLQLATGRAQERLNALLLPHGIEVYEIALSKPSFDKVYEDTLERREVAEQELQSLGAQAALFAAGQPALLNEVGRKKDLEIEKARAKWRQQLIALEQEAERLRGGRPEELAHLEQHKRFALEKARGDWRAEIGALEEGARELERGLALRLERMEREHALELERRADERERELAALSAEAAGMRAAHELRTLALEREKELERGRMRAQLAQESEAARAAALRSELEARSQRDARLAAARAQREQLLVAAAALEEKARRAHRSFLARAEAFEEHGPAAVRAALVERLSSILFEIAPFAPPPEAPAPWRAASRGAAGATEGGR